MKNLILVVALIFAYSIMAKANVSGVVTGELAVHGAQAEIYSKMGNYTVDIDEEVNSCFDGVFQITEGKLVQVITCRDKGAMAHSFKSTKGNDNVLFGNKGNFCPLFYSPVCGIVEGRPTTFGNDCELKSNGATKIYSGSCRNAESLFVRALPVHNIEKN